LEELTSYLGWKTDFTVPRGEPAFCGPDSVSWRVFKNPVVSAIGGVCAVLLEFADDRIRTGVWEHSVFPTDPVGRGQRTYMAAMVGLYGPRSAARAVIGRIGTMHARVEGVTPNGRPYSATDPELIDWVHATAAYGWFTAYDRFVSKLSQEDELRFFAEGTEGAKLYHVTNTVRSLADFHAMLAKLEDHFEPHPINRDFLDIIRSGKAAANLPAWMHRALAHASIDILPPKVRATLGLGPEFDLTFAQRITVRALAWLGETIPDKKSAPAQACERLGLPRDFLWKSERAQARLLEQWRAAAATRMDDADAPEPTGSTA